MSGYLSKILVLDDDKDLTKTVSMILNTNGTHVDTAYSGKEAADKIEKNSYQVLFVDLKLPDMDGMKLVHMAHQKDPDTQVIILTGHPSLDSAIEAIQEQVFDYIPKPSTNEKLRIVARNALSKYNLLRQNRELIEKITQQDHQWEEKMFKATEKLSKQTRTDDLTKLYNRRYLHERLDDEVKKSLRYNQPLSMMMIDIDMFKRYNDTMGHHEGDNLIKSVGQLIRDKMRKFDLVARCGGDEFCVVLPHTSGTASVVAAEKLRDLVENSFKSFQPEIFEKGLTVSIGVATLPIHAHSKTELNESADRALYRAKREGRNRVCLPIN